MNDICNHCGLYGCYTSECILNKNNYKKCICCKLTGHDISECSFKNIVKKINKKEKEIINYILCNYPDIVININNISPLKKNIIIRDICNGSSNDSNINNAKIILCSLDGVSVYKYYYIIYNNGHMECVGTE